MGGQAARRRSDGPTVEADAAESDEVECVVSDRSRCRPNLPIPTAVTTLRGPIDELEDLPGTAATSASVLDALLREHPEALVAAIAGSTEPQRVPVPDSLGVDPERFTKDLTPYVDRMDPESRASLAKLWGTARTRGAAVAPVRLPGIEGPANLYMLDFRRDHGVIVVVVTPGDTSPADHLVDALRLPALPPRLARAGKDAAAFITWTDPALSQILGWEAEELVGRRVIEFVHPDDRELGILNWMEMLDTPGVAHPIRLRHQHRDGSWVWLEVTNFNRLEDPAHRDILAEMVDISDQMEALEALHAREQLLRQVTETVHVGLFHTDLGGTLLYCNSRLADLTGAPATAGLSDQLESVVIEDRIRLDEAVQVARAGTETDVEVRIQVGGRGIRHCKFSLRPLHNESGSVTGLTGCVEDVTLAVRKREALEAQATSDPLTGCLNRSAALAVLQELLDRPDPAGRPNTAGTAVIFIDLDGFKPVNDRLGHGAGDEVLTSVADRIRSSMRSGDVVGRFGGDEFVIICPGVTSADQALSVAHVIGSRVFDEPIMVAEEAVTLTASLGVAWTDGLCSDSLTLIRQADTAMYESKRRNLGLPVLFDAD